MKRSMQLVDVGHFGSKSFKALQVTSGLGLGGLHEPCGAQPLPQSSFVCYHSLPNQAIYCILDMASMMSVIRLTTAGDLHHSDSADPCRSQASQAGQKHFR